MSSSRSTPAFNNVVKYEEKDIKNNEDNENDANNNDNNDNNDNLVETFQKIEIDNKNVVRRSTRTKRKRNISVDIEADNKSKFKSKSNIKRKNKTSSKNKIEEIEEKEKEEKVGESSAKKIKTLEKNLIDSRNDVKLIHVIPSGEIKFTIPSSDKTALYTTSFQIGNGDDKPEVQFKCDCGDKYGIFNRNNCKHVGRIVSFIVEEYVKIGMANKPRAMNMGQIEKQLSNISIHE